jgi:WhiB family redox-sensing transcriptional regulator
VPRGYPASPPEHMREMSAASAAAKTTKVAARLARATKGCPRCLELKPLQDFAPAPSQPDGRAGWCRSCVAAQMRARREKAKRDKAFRRAKAEAEHWLGTSARRPTPELELELWRRQAACAGTGQRAFFDDHDGEALRICASCSVRSECLEEALAHDSYGVWGGTTRTERLEIQRVRQLLRPADHSTGSLSC